MKKTGAALVVHALEQLPITHTFGVPGVHNTEIYDALSRSEKIKPVLVTHEGGGAFMADAISRTTNTIGTMVIVPAAGATHAMSGIGEAFLDGIPMLVISGGIRTDTDKKYQLHDIDQHRLLAAVTKQTYRVKEHNHIVKTIFDAYNTAVSGEPGPVFVEIPVNIAMFQGDVDEIPSFKAHEKEPMPKPALIQASANLLTQAKKPAMFLGWGACTATKSLISLADLLNAPTATTLQGLSAFPASHPLHVGMGFGRSAVPAAENAFKDCDCLLAVGTRFSEIPTGSYGIEVPENLIHIDINPDVFDKNFPAKVALQGDAATILPALLAEVTKINPKQTHTEHLRQQIKQDKAAYFEEWNKHRTERVNPYLFFRSLRNQLDDNAITVVDDGNHTFLTAELFPVFKPRHFISPTDFNCMGYCVPAAIGAKFANPDQQVVGIVGDGAFLMTCMETLTATSYELGVVYFVFSDGELSQISQGQEIPFNRKTCTILGKLSIEGVAKATGASYLQLNSNSEIEPIIGEALAFSAKGQPVIVDVNIDYSKRTRFTQGVVKTVLKRFSIRDKIRFIGRALWRKVTG